jgi:hypothetical protein
MPSLGVDDETRRRGTSRRPVVAACAWCGRLSSDREVWYAAPQWLVLQTGDRETLLTHGICPSCLSRFMRDVPEPSDGLPG